MPNIFGSLSLQMEHPNVVTNFYQLEQSCKNKLVTVFLDYDGTLTPIVNNPDEAYLPHVTRETIRELANLFPTAIISGRGRAKVEDFVKLSELYYAGSHGMDIAAPKTPSQIDVGFQPAAQYESLIQTVTERLAEAVKSIRGSTVENNRYCVSVHFRNCLPEDYMDVVNAVESIVAAEPELHMTRGRKVLEVRPKVEWNKGSALLHLLSMLGIRDEEVFCLYIGDDRTDEDAFKVLRDKNLGAGILVSSKAKPTSGIWTCRDPQEVAELLQKLVKFGCSGSNSWHQRQSCKGWQIVSTT